jgi:phospholipase D1/2
MEHALEAINSAKEEIYITDWWLCPEVFLKRPSIDLQNRLDKVLIKKSVYQTLFIFSLIDLY